MLAPNDDWQLDVACREPDAAIHLRDRLDHPSGASRGCSGPSASGALALVLRRRAARSNSARPGYFPSFSVVDGTLTGPQ